MNEKRHWEAVYSKNRPEAVSWFQPSAERSLALIRSVAPDLNVPIIDVGGGTSVLVDDLLGAGYKNLSVLDLAGSALAVAKARLGPAASAVRWIEADVRTADLPTGAYGVWHDRAVFHFLTRAADRAAYVAQVQRTLRVGGYALVATFAEDGPSKCSGLPVARYSAQGLHDEFGDSFELVAAERESHSTPMGIEQPFIYCLCRWRGD